MELFYTLLCRSFNSMSASLSRCQTLARHNSLSRSSGVMHSTMIRGKWSHFPVTQLSRRFNLIPIQTRFNINVSLPRNNSSLYLIPSSACISSRNLIGPSAWEETRTGIWCRWVNRVSASLCIYHFANWTRGMILVLSSMRITGVST